jgi:hypothetical protein
MIKILTGHTSQATAHLVTDYPYGFRLRCKIRYWLEHDAAKGTRMCSQTTDPRTGNVHWNKPKKSTYSPVGVMYLDEQGHCTWTTASHYEELPVLRAWLTEYSCGLDDLAFYAAGRILSQKKSYERLKAAGVPYPEAGKYAIAIGLNYKDNTRAPYSTADALAHYASHKPA